MDAVVPLAGQIVQILAPFLPYLVKVGEGLGTRAAQQMEDKGWDLATKLWGRLAAQVDAKPSVKEAAADVAAQPADEDARAALRVQIKSCWPMSPLAAGARGAVEGGPGVRVDDDRHRERRSQRCHRPRRPRQHDHHRRSNPWEIAILRAVSDSADRFAALAPCGFTRNQAHNFRFVPPSEAQSAPSPGIAKERAQRSGRPRTSRRLRMTLTP